MTNQTRRLQLIDAALSVLRTEGAPELPIAILQSWLDVERRFEKQGDPDSRGWIVPPAERA